MTAAHWEVVPAREGNTIIGYQIRWSEPDEEKRFLWVGHYYAGPGAEGPSIGWCEIAARNHAKRLNEQGKCPWEFKAWRPTTMAVTEQTDPVNHPPHYNQGSIECIDALESIDVGEGFCRGNAIKYLWRMGSKGDSLEDARKAQWYVNRLVSILERKRSPEHDPVKAYEQAINKVPTVPVG